MISVNLTSGLRRWLFDISEEGNTEQSTVYQMRDKVDGSGFWNVHDAFEMMIAKKI